MKIRHLLILALLPLLFSCEDDPVDKPNPPQPKKEVVVPKFSADSAYAYVEDQVNFGPRIPNSEAHKQCGNYLVEKLESFGAEVLTQESTVKAYDGTKLEMKNIIGQFQPENKRRILLLAHWDTRPWADKDSVLNKQRKPIDGANDGGSGVGVLLEVARHLAGNKPDHGIDIIFFDAEDYGTPEFSDEPGDTYSWCLGSQYWGENPHKPGYRAKYGILLDMVGSTTAKFPKEGTSMHYAPHIVDKIWKSAKKTGNGGLFGSDISGMTTDDHTFVNILTGIPSACIVEYHTGPIAMGLAGYGRFHHTHNDNMSIISKESLEAVGETVMHVIYNE